MRKFWIIAGAGLLLGTAASADEYVNGYTKKDGTYVQPYHRSNPDGNPYNNYSTRGNVNPYTGQPGTKNPYATAPSPYLSPAPQPVYNGQNSGSPN